MSDAVEIGSLVGTWVAAGIAIVALIGVLGPLLVWRTIRGERHKAIDKLSRGDAETADYVSTGVRITSTIRLFRHFNAPNLRSAPFLRKSTLVWNNNAPLVTFNSASWVKFGKTLECYGLDYSTTKSLEIRNGQVYLPVHKIWLLIIGIVGRYGQRKDSGKLIIKPARGIASTQARPGRHVTFNRSASQRKSSLYNRTGYMNPFSYEPQYQPLYGVTGMIELCAPDETSESNRSLPQEVLFSCHTSSEIGILPNDPLGIVQLFWLAVGCLPAPESRVYSLDDVELVPIQEERPDSLMPETSFFPNLDPANDNPYPLPNGPQPSSFNQYVVPVVTPNLNTRKEDARAFQFSTINQRVSELDEVAKSIRVDDTNQVYSLEELKPNRDIMDNLKGISQATYIPADFSWVRFARVSAAQSNWFLKRDDAQLLAQALLSLPLSSVGYIVGGDKRSLCRQLLCAAAQSLFQLLVRLNKSLQPLGVTGSDATQLSQLMATVYTNTETKECTRPHYEAINSLDVALSTRLHPDTRVNNAIGILMLTNEEFRDMIAQSARHIDESINTSVVLDVVNSTLNVPAVMGFTQRFPIALALLHPGLPNDDGPITITFREVMFAALKASVRSTFLGTSLDSLPLFRTVLEMDEIVYIGSSQY